MRGVGSLFDSYGFRGHSASKRMKHLLQRPCSPVINGNVQMEHYPKLLALWEISFAQYCGACLNPATSCNSGKNNHHYLIRGPLLTFMIHCYSLWAGPSICLIQDIEPWSFEHMFFVQTQHRTTQHRHVCKSKTLRFHTPWCFNYDKDGSSTSLLRIVETPTRLNSHQQGQDELSAKGKLEEVLGGSSQLVSS